MGFAFNIPNSGFMVTFMSDSLLLSMHRYSPCVALHLQVLFLLPMTRNLILPSIEFRENK